MLSSFDADMTKPPKRKMPQPEIDFQSKGLLPQTLFNSAIVLELTPKEYPVRPGSK